MKIPASLAFILLVLAASVIGASTQTFSTLMSFNGTGTGSGLVTVSAPGGTLTSNQQFRVLP